MATIYKTWAEIRAQKLTQAERDVVDAEVAVLLRDMEAKEAMMPKEVNTKTLLAYVAATVVAVLLAAPPLWVLKTLYEDHMLLHDVVTAINQQAQAVARAQQMVQPTPAPAQSTTQTPASPAPGK